MKRQRRSFRNSVPGRVWKAKKLNATLLSRRRLIDKLKRTDE